MRAPFSSSVKRALRGWRSAVGLAVLAGLTALTGLAHTQQVAQPEPANSPALQAFERFFNDIDTFEARFVQVVLDENLKTIDDAQGTLWIKRPGRFRWDYAPPDAQEIVADGERVWLHDIALEQVTVRDQASTLGRTPAILLAGTGDFGQSFAIQDIGTQGRVDWVNLIPEDSESGFTEVRIGFEAHRLRLMELLDTLDQRTRISFVDLKENAPLADQIFEFVPPEGIDVIDESGQEN